MSESMGLWKPTIAAINGFAIAGGFMMAMQCDIRVVADHARIGIAEVRWNMGGAGWMVPVTRQIGLGMALELCLWGDTQLTAERVYQIGWAQRVVPLDQLMETAMEYARRAIDQAPRAVRNNKQAIYRGFYMNPIEAQALGGALEQNLQGMQDSVGAQRPSRRSAGRTSSTPERRSSEPLTGRGRRRRRPSPLAASPRERERVGRRATISAHHTPASRTRKRGKRHDDGLPGDRQGHLLHGRQAQPR